MGAGRGDGHDRDPQICRQAEFITYLCTLVTEGSVQDLQEAALAFWRVYPKISPTFARRLLRALRHRGVPEQRFEPALLAVLARCYLSCGQIEKACDYLTAARKIMPLDAPYALVCAIGELEVNAGLARSQLEAAQDAWQRLEGVAQQVCGGLTSKQLILGVRLSFAQGDMSQAAWRAAQAVKCARDDEQCCRAQLAALKIDAYLEGDSRHELIQLVTLERFQHMRSHGPLSTETRAQLLYRLAYSFFSQGKFDQAALRLRKANPQADWPFGMPEFVAAALALVEGHPDKARRYLELQNNQSVTGLSHTEHLEQQFRTLLISQALEGASRDLEKAEEFFRLCHATGHGLLRQRASLLLASSLVGVGDYERALFLLQERTVQATRHKALRLMRGCLLALCDARREEEAHPGSAPPVLEPSLGYLADLLADEDTVAVMLFLTRVHPYLIELIVKQGLRSELSLPVQQLLSSRLEVAQRSLREQVTLPRFMLAEAAHDMIGTTELSLASVFSWNQGRPNVELSREPLFAQGLFPDAPRVLQIQLFGGLQVRRHGDCLDLDHLRRAKVRDLIVILALARGREISRDLIVERLWPQQNFSRSLNSFYVVWNALKKVFLADGTPLPSYLYSPEQFPFSNAGGRCSLLMDYCDLDLNTFDQLVCRAREAAYQGQGEACLKYANELMALYSDEILPADLESEQLNYVRLHYQKTFVDVMLLAARLALTQRRAQAALPFIERGLAAGPSCEELYRLAMHAYALEGRRDDSLRAYHRCRKNLARELGIEPSTELSELFAQLASTSLPAPRQTPAPQKFLADSHVLREVAPKV
ncbi:MAG: tetratricopeptide repeat protein [Coriobacteriia bacterium]|nr:tetratricopeptide repeat protein [Coriobacteriia bacterium]